MKRFFFALSIVMLGSFSAVSAQSGAVSPSPQVGPSGEFRFVSGRGRSRTYDPRYVEAVL